MNVSATVLAAIRCRLATGCDDDKSHPRVCTCSKLDGDACSVNSCTEIEVANPGRSIKSSISGTTEQEITLTCDDGYGGSGPATCQINGSFTTLRRTLCDAGTYSCGGGYTTDTDAAFCTACYSANSQFTGTTSLSPAWITPPPPIVEILGSPPNQFILRRK